MPIGAGPLVWPDHPLLDLIDDPIRNRPREFRLPVPPHPRPRIDWSGVPATRAGIYDVITDPAFSSGDRIILQAGTFVWTGSDATAWIDGSDPDIDGKWFDIIGQGPDTTIIQDNLGTMVNTPPLISVNLPANQIIRILGIGFIGGTRLLNHATIIAQGPAGAGAIDSRRFRVGYCKFTDVPFIGVRPVRCYGTIDHCTFISNGNNIPIYVVNANDYDWADQRWTDPLNFDAASDNDYVFIEDCDFQRPTPSSGTAYAATDSFGGSRIVFRHNTLLNCWNEMHGTESAGRARGTRLMVHYLNTYTTNANISSLDRMGNLRSGVAMMYENTGVNMDRGITTPISMQLTNQRTLRNFSCWMQANGEQPWDINNASNPFYTQTVTAVGGTGNRTLTVAGTPWTAVDLVGYSIVKVGAIANSNAYAARAAGLIVSNTANTVTFDDGDGSTTPNMSFTGGDQFRLNKITQVLDAVGRGGGALMAAKYMSSISRSGTTVTVRFYQNHGWTNGDLVGITDVSMVGDAIEDRNPYIGTFAISNVVAVDGTATYGFDYTVPEAAPFAPEAGLATKKPSAFNDQTAQPVYNWSNYNDSVLLTTGPFDIYKLFCIENQHYYEHKTSFTGAAGIGVGAGVGSRPSAASCTLGVGWWDSTARILYTVQDIGGGTKGWVVYYTEPTYPNALNTEYDFDPEPPTSTVGYKKFRPRFLRK